MRRILEANIPDFGSARNPCDVTGQVVNTPLSMPTCSDALLSDAAYGALVVPQTLAFDKYKARLESLGVQSEHYGHAHAARIARRRVIGGFRSVPAVDLDRLADILVRVSEFAADQRDLITELDINPIICAGSSMMVVDALIVRSSAILQRPHSQSTLLSRVST